MYNRLEFTFQPVFLFAEDACETGCKAEMERTFPMGAVPESASKIEASKRDTVSATPPSGKRIPESASSVGRVFRLGLDWETPSHSQ